MSALDYSNEVSTGPAIEPVSVAEAKRNCDIDDSYRDVDISRWIVEARKQVEHDSRLSLVNQTWVKKLDSFPAESYITLRKPLVSVTSLAYVDTGGSSQTWASSNYEVDTARGLLWLAYSISWPNIRDIQNAVTVTYVSGHGAATSTVPEAAKSAILLMVKHRFENAGPMEDFANTGTYQGLIDQLRGGVYP